MMRRIGADGRFTGSALAATLASSGRADDLAMVVAAAGSTNAGVVDDLRFDGPREPVSPTYYYFQRDAENLDSPILSARFTGDPQTASLKVSFFGPFYGGYHVIALDPDYRWAMVIGPTTGYLWILAREPVLDPAVRERLVAQARAVGVATDELIWVEHGRALR